MWRQCSIMAQTWPPAISLFTQTGAHSASFQTRRITGPMHCTGTSCTLHLPTVTSAPGRSPDQTQREASFLLAGNGKGGKALK
uniref:Putative secreted protein n=1 Tax=Anopheles marajoara TaxID=58244 RepID=A0A2M4CBQ3_9DIPT